MVDYYLTRFACEMGKPIPRLSAQAVELLTSYNWPGNVRELRNICERLIVLCDSTDIEVGDIRMLKIFRNLDSRPVFSGRQHKASAQEPDNLYASLKPRKKKQDIARELGVSRTTLWRLEKLAKQERQEKDKE